MCVSATPQRQHNCLSRCVQDDEQPLAFADIDQLTVFTDNVRLSLDDVGIVPAERRTRLELDILT